MSGAGKSSAAEDLGLQEGETRRDVCIISDEPDTVERAQALCLDFAFSCAVWTTFESFLENAKGPYKLVVVSLSDLSQFGSLAELAQGIRFIVQDISFVICCVPKSIDRGATEFAKKSGADIILMRDEVFSTSKLEFSALQTIFSTFIPIKTSDLIPDRTMDFDLYHLLAQREKFLKFSAKGNSLSEKKFEKCSKTGEIYIRRADATAFKSFVASRNDQSAAGLARRCRAQFLDLSASFLNFVLLLSDQSETGSFSEGQRLLKICQSMCDELLGLLGETGDAWDIINNSAIGQLGSIERAPAVAAYAGIFGLQMGLDNINETMLAALLCDIGLILLPPQITKKIREEKLHEQTPEEKKIYENYPNLSLELLLSRKLALDDKFRAVLLSTNERADGRGFPKGFGEDKLNLSGQLIQFCRDLDRRTMLRLGKPRPNRAAILQVIQSEAQSNFRFSGKFWEMIGTL